jgi:hypothetical protein
MQNAKVLGKKPCLAWRRRQELIVPSQIGTRGRIAVKHVVGVGIGAIGGLQFLRDVVACPAKA